MIHRNTVNTLGLKPMTRSMCHDLYVQIYSENDPFRAVLEQVTQRKENGRRLNHLWWALNYYAELLDPDRNHRARVERHLDALARETDSPQDTD